MPSLTDEQIERARSIGALEYLRNHEPRNLKHEGGGRYTLRDHDSLVLSNGKFYWNSHGVGGATELDFLMIVRGLDFVEAVNQLCKSTDMVFTTGRSPPHAREPKLPKQFSLPPANANNDRVYAYLRGRGIDSDIIRQCMATGLLYEAAKSHSCVFVGFDGDVPKYACERSTTSGTKRDVAGSSKQYGFFTPPKENESHNLMVCEAPCDVLAHSTIHRLDGDKWDGYRLSLGGVSSLALMGFLERHPHINSIQLSLDNDKAGRDATGRIIRELLSDSLYSHIKITIAPPPIGKDMADTLTAVLQLYKERTHTGRQKLAAKTM